MLDFVGTVAISIAMVVSFVTVVTTVSSNLAQRMSLAAIAGAWIGVALALGTSGAFADTTRPAPIGVLAVAPLIAAFMAVLLFPGVRSALLAVPTPLLIGLNVWRIFGGFFLLLAASGRLAGPFPYSAGWGDVITGVLALPIAVMVARGAGLQAAQWWNAFGALDLVAAVFFGITSAAGSPLQIFQAGVGSEAVQHLPWALIPTVMVPLFLIVHAVIFVQLRQRARAHDPEKWEPVFGKNHAPTKS